MGFPYASKDSIVNAERCRQIAVYRSVPRRTSETIRREENLKKQWIHAIRRDVGPNFSINKGTRGGRSADGSQRES
ncbi:hypothetical protein P5673_020167 [Acropora cervicornis]|uniref:Uncharacterized protein n=1 Tax=Acropora cervicornis TaxID=6130 RepID=A0AAD9Q9Z6_ACRCE|nr:hypothetical protein P5673_020167 [Acropora cervicornis]